MLRRDWPALLGYTLVTLATTFPLIRHMGDGWMPELTEDLMLKLWDAWRMRLMLAADAPLYHTSVIFYPHGVSLAFHSTSFTTTLAIRLFAAALGDLTAYKVVTLLGLLTTAYAAYLLILDLVGGRAAAWLGGAIYAFAPYHMAHVFAHPDLTQLAPLPLAALLLIRAVTTASIPAAIGAGVMVGLAGWTSLYALVFTALTLAPLAVFFLLEGGRWRQRRTWLAAGVIALVGLVMLAPRLAPGLLRPASLEGAIDAKTETEVQIDPLAYLIPTHHPLLAPLFADTAEELGAKTLGQPPFLGYAAILLALVALIRQRPPRRVWLWAAIGAMFVTLSLGPYLEFGGENYRHIELPAAALYHVELIRAIRPHFFQIGLLLPLAVLAAYGLQGLLTSIRRPALQAALAAAAIGLTLFEYWSGPVTIEPLPPTPAIDVLAQQEGEFAVINLPMGYGEGKQYMFEQTVHGHPIEGGAVGRMPADAYAYADANPLLHAWREGRGCLDVQPGGFEQAIDALLADGFRYVVVHREIAETEEVSDEYDAFFEGIQPVFGDDQVRVYALDGLRGAVCPHAVAGLPAAQAARTQAISDRAGTRACGVFGLRGHGWKIVEIADFPACQGATEHPSRALTLQCLNGDGEWEAAEVSDYDVDSDTDVVSFTAHQDGTCGFFIRSRAR